MKNSSLNNLNPWLSMWSQPRTTIRAILNENPTYGWVRLVALFSLESFFFYANWWSLGLQASFPVLLFLGILLSPLIGAAWIYLMGAIYFVLGRLLNGEASAVALRAAIVWSKIPLSISLLMWVVLLLIDPKDLFIQGLKGGHFLIFISFVNLALSTWSLILFIQALREVQEFPLWKAILNIFLSSSVFFILTFSLLFLFNYISQ